MINPTAEAVRAFAHHTDAHVPAHSGDDTPRIEPAEVGVSLLGERLLAAARIAATLHAQAAGIGATPEHGADR